MDGENLLYETGERITTITINRPRSLNSLNDRTLEALERALVNAQKDPDTKVILITGVGDRAFVAGADLKELSVLDPVRGREVALKGQTVFRFMETLGKPTLAVINGFALGFVKSNRPSSFE